MDLIEIIMIGILALLLFGFIKVMMKEYWCQYCQEEPSFCDIDHKLRCFIRIVVFIIFVLLLNGIHNYYLAFRAPNIYVKSTLLAYKYVPLTHKYKGVLSFSDDFITIWDCQEFGKLIADDKNIFRFSKPVSTLILKKYNNKIEIWDIVKECDVVQ